ncbi:MAG: AAA family ATPase [Chloroflexota bacterium]|nr:AAA family ATPase [Chloroflexota bacterium]
MVSKAHLDFNAAYLSFQTVILCTYELNPRIKAIGKFDRPFRAVNIEKFNIIYADNGRGKSMLAAILRSLSTGEPRIIMERHTLGSTNVPEVSLLIDNHSRAEFQNQKWSMTLPEVEVFDAAFVSSNVYSGDSVELDHRRNLYRFVLGSQGVALASQVDELDKDSRAKQKKIRERETEIRRHIVGGMSVSKFLKLQPVSDTELEKKRAEIDALEESENIVSKSHLSPSTLPKVSLETLKKLLAKSLPDISKEAERITLEHIADYLDEEGQSWLETGFSYTKSDICPFCGASILGNNLIQAYRSYFDEAYAAFKLEISEFTSSVMDTLSEKQILHTQSVITSNNTLAEFWSDYVPTTYPAITFEKIAKIWKSVRLLLVADLNRKKASPLEKLEPSQALIEMLDAYQTLQTDMEAYNVAVDAVNVLIAAKKNEVSTGDLSRARTELRVLECRKTRFRDSIVDLCEVYETLKKEKRELDKQKKEAKKRLDKAANNLLRKYQKAINRYLMQCGAGFKIADTKTTYLGGKPSAGYCLEINAKRVELGTSEVNACFRNTLSEGDKSTLAFAFFLARLDQDPDLSAKIVVFDDPVSSLDANRRQFTRDQIVRISKTAQQVIVLTHDLYLARKVWDGIRTKNKNALQIKRAGEQYSVITAWDLESATRGEYYRNYNVLADYLENSYRDDDHLRAVARCIRPLLEGNLRMRFPQAFKENEWLGDFLTKIREAQDGDPLFCLQPQYEEISNINDYSKNYHHDQNSGASNEPICDSQLSPYVRRTLKVIGGILSSV